jgi:small-conductance mechanosensitive channel
LFEGGCGVTVGFEVASETVESALMQAYEQMTNSGDVLAEPKAYVWITNFGNYAVEYTLYVFIEQIKRLPEIDANLKKAVLASCNKHNIDISTPTIIKSLKE